MILQDSKLSQILAITIFILDVHVVVIVVYNSTHKSTHVATVLASGAEQKRTVTPRTRIVGGMKVITI